MATPEPNAIAAAAAKLITDCIGTWAARNPAPQADDQYLEAGQWIAGVDGAQPAYRQGGPAVACAVAHVNNPEGDTYNILRSLSEQSVDWALSPAGRAAIHWCGTGPADAIHTMMFAQDLGTVIVLLDGRTAPAKMTVWKTALREAADYLIDAGHVQWYSNGNINLGYTLVLYLASRVFPGERYAQAWRDSLAFTQNPTPGAHWSDGGTGAKFGLREENSSSWQIGYDGVAFFSEQSQPGWPVGYDGEYTMVQLDVLTRLALLSGDPEVTDLASRVLNKTLQRTNFETWTVDCGLGTRHTAPSWDRALTSPALHVLNSLGRELPLEVRQAQWARVEAEFRSTPILLRPNVVYYKGLGSWVGLVVLNDLVSRGVVARVL